MRLDNLIDIISKEIKTVGGLGLSLAKIDFTKIEVVQNNSMLEGYKNKRSLSSNR